MPDMMSRERPTLAHTTRRTVVILLAYHYSLICSPSITPGFPSWPLACPTPYDTCQNVYPIRPLNLELFLGQHVQLLMVLLHIYARKH
jgi:hypothetical protein